MKFFVGKLPVSVKALASILSLSQTSPGVYLSVGQVFENTVGKGKIAQNLAISSFPRVFSIGFENFLSFSSKFETVICKVFKLTRV